MWGREEKTFSPPLETMLTYAWGVATSFKNYINMDILIINCKLISMSDFNYIKIKMICQQVQHKLQKTEYYSY